MNKSASTFKCVVHCLIYTAVVFLATMRFVQAPVHWAILIFVSHFFIDRFSLADLWLEFIGGRSLFDFMTHGDEKIPEDLSAENYKILRGGFTSVVYTVTDNTMHLILLICFYYFVI